ncbi:SusC/RagA family TonB-linked outer membrane protein [Spirosoma montaniterrae]|uniref:SusC/RagA family TonB-linked outer membrane protein n=1 Tax=Spirosoma montaniterrae TaxID=1178516 RepID=A0A1P9WRD5_9BACT|nr:TonB-dependent receptor [Spirosoma montaniterrae]AQG77931.1 SusC/RagA family TonB-linked outer membrane protein [Spirosoma montaniterrae]
MNRYATIHLRHWLGLLGLSIALNTGLPLSSAAIHRLPTAARPFVTLSGTVTDEQGSALPGVSIVEKQTKKGTVTDGNGQFSIDVVPGATLVFSFIGFTSQEIVVGQQTTLRVQLKEEVNQLAEVVAVGYQTLRKSDVTGAISNVKARELNLAAPTLGQALVGKLAGVQVAQVSGAPYVGTKIRVRGIGSINASSDPLYVIDGFPAGNDVFINPNDIESIDILKDAASAAIYGSRASGGVVLITTKRGKDGKGKLDYEYQFGINQLARKVKLLNSEQFVDLLIDARNNTYRDLMQNAGRPFTNANFSDPNATRIANVGNAGAVSIPTEFYDFANQRAIAPQYNTDWQDELYRNAPVNRHNLQFSGGTTNTRYLLSAGYQNQQGIIVATKQERLNLRANIDADLSPKLKVGTSFFITSTNNREVQEGRFNQGPILGALIYPPIFRAYDDNGNLIKNESARQQPTFGYQTVENPVALAQETNITRRGLRGTYNGTVSYEIIKGLIARANVGLQTFNEKYDFYLPTSLSNGNNPPFSPQAIAAARATAQTTDTRNLLGEFTATYTRQFGLHNLSLLGGYTAQRITSDQISVSAQGFQNDRVPEITAKGADPTNFFLNTGNTGKYEETLLSYLARATYSFDERYFLTAAFRTDGSSRFGPLNRWGNFPSLSAGWTVSNEPFYRDWLGAASTLKLRASWGLTGNYNIPNYGFLQTMANPGGVVFGTNAINTAYWAGPIKDQALGWETTSQYNVGVDVGLLNNRLLFIANGYLSYSYDLLFNQPISAISGAASILTNLRDSRIRNRGIEFQVDGRVISTQDAKVTLSGNIALNQNRVLNMGGSNAIFSVGAERQYITHTTQEGFPIGSFYGFKVIGMVREKDMAALAEDNANYNSATQSFNPGYTPKGPARSTASSNPLRPGDLLFEDVDGNGVVNDADKRVIGTPFPKFTYGFSATASYKAFDFNASFNGVYGNQVLDGQDYYVFNMEASGNQYAIVNDRYRSETQPGNGEVYRAARGGTQSNSTRLSTFYLQNGSYFRCTNLTLGYNLPVSLLSKVKVSGLRLYANVNNAFTITKYKGYNPEVDYNAGLNVTPGVDYGMYPLARGYNVGARITF